MNELPDSAFGVLRLFLTSKEETQRFSVQLINAVKNGNINPLELKAYLKRMESISEIVDKATRKEQMTEADKYHQTEFEVYGYSIKKSVVKTEYDYSACGDTVFERREVDADTATRLLNERKEFLKSLKEPLTTVDELTGEVVTIKPPIKKTIDGLKFTMK